MRSLRCIASAAQDVPPFSLTLKTMPTLEAISGRPFLLTELADGRPVKSVRVEDLNWKDDALSILSLGWNSTTDIISLDLSTQVVSVTALDLLSGVFPNLERLALLRGPLEGHDKNKTAEKTMTYLIALAKPFPRLKLFEIYGIHPGLGFSTGERRIIDVKNDHPSLQEVQLAKSARCTWIEDAGWVYDFLLHPKPKPTICKDLRRETNKALDEVFDQRNRKRSAAGRVPARVARVIGWRY
ncbi:hypothetical protein M422DRAFT_34225 [Sphaerobolus stellatus SS14]|uniref:Unplaced genomic scaffold SPHSTscaffold_105, whole genome shotgun sequence n=1 Tax=Sphaerobolus stellatus (strain SS14) TaxID=990650 RepID=A0A0C9UP10_SPHS4|nr:hypothetical protein M422DRAFT_34376 [Sphaerobolus stellatus SS14]KIJ36544.1 hypothetical protein M422DRAFT_34225 [Sphaerobolus stellatus SS14]